MITVADQDKGIAFLGKFDSLDVYFGHQWTGGVDHAKATNLTGFTYFRRNSVGAVNDPFAIRHFFNAINENGTFALQLFHYETVMDDLLAHIDGRAESFEG